MDMDIDQVLPSSATRSFYYGSIMITTINTPFTSKYNVWMKWIIIHSHTIKTYLTLKKRRTYTNIINYTNDTMIA